MKHNEIETYLRKVSETRREHIEQMACALLLKLGPYEFAQYSLCEQHDHKNGIIRWWFEKRADRN